MRSFIQFDSESWDPMGIFHCGSLENGFFLCSVLLITGFITFPYFFLSF